MCGIAGIVRLAGPPPERELRAMVGVLVHRGPDGEGGGVEGGAGIGVRRLAVVDLSPLGDQPMAGEDATTQVVFDGDHADLRSRLVAHRHAFRGRSDTEVLVRGYEQFGAAGLLAQLEGLFAFAVLDRRRRKRVLARDHFGVKPLHVRTASGQVSFASEVRALRRVLRKVLPATARRPKRRLEALVDAWFRKLDAGRLRTRLLGGWLEGTLGFSRAPVAALIERHARGEDVGRRLFALLMLELWGRRFT